MPPKKAAPKKKKGSSIAKLFGGSKRKKGSDWSSDDDDEEEEDAAAHLRIKRNQKHRKVWLSRGEVVDEFERTITDGSAFDKASKHGIPKLSKDEMTKAIAAASGAFEP